MGRSVFVDCVHDPVCVGTDPGEHTREVLRGVLGRERCYTYLQPGSATFTHQGAPTVTLQQDELRVGMPANRYKRYTHRLHNRRADM